MRAAPQATSAKSASVMCCACRLPPALTSKACTDVLRVRIDERRLRAFDVFEARALRCQRVRAPGTGRIRDRAAEGRRGICEPEKGDHVVLIDPVSGGADTTHQCVASIDGDAAGKDLQAVSQANVGVGTSGTV